MSDPKPVLSEDQAARLCPKGSALTALLDAVDTIGHDVECSNDFCDCLAWQADVLRKFAAAVRAEDAALRARIADALAERDAAMNEVGELGIVNEGLALKLAAARRELEEKRNGEFERILGFLGIDPGDECKRCSGVGRATYGSTATWRGGIGGQVMTVDVCNRCWGSGSASRPWVRAALDRAREGE